MRRKRKLPRRRFLIESLEARRLLASDFTLAILPDTQYYSESNPATFNSQTQWLANNVPAKNIAFVSHVGDVVEHATSESEWQSADTAMDTLDGVVPYSVIPGNHDFTMLGSHGSSTNFVSNFGSSRYSGASWYGGSSANQLNHYQMFSAGGHQFLHLGLEWEPRAGTVSWAQSILDANPTTPTIVTTHAYLHPSGGRFTGAVSADGLDGEQLFQSLITVNPQIFLVMGGHFSGESHEISYNNAGLPVLEMVTDYQSRPNGGNGFMQLLEFRPDFDTIEVTTYSPTLDQFETDADSQFTFSLDFDARLNFAGAPTASLTSPQDNGSGDSDPADGFVTVNTAQANLEVQLSDIVPGINDGSVTAATVQLTRDGMPLSSPSDYTFGYDAGTDRLTLSAATGTFGNGLYQLTLNGGGATIADQAGNQMPTTSFDVTIDTSILAPPDSLYFSLSSQATLAGGVVADNEDVVFFDGSDFSLFFDGSDVGLSAFTIDGMAVLNPSELLLSFTGSATIPGISGTVDDSDIVKFTATQFGDATSGTFTRYFDASDVGLTTSDEDIDALTVLGNGHLLVSTKGPFDAGGVLGDDEDLFEFTPTSLGDNTSGSWSLYLDGSDLTGFADEDVYGVGVYPNGDVYLSTSGSFSVPGLSGKDEDVFAFTPTSLGSNTSGTFVAPLYFDGSQHGLSRKDIYALHIPNAGPTNAPPVAEDDEASVDEDGVTTIDVLIDNGQGADHDSDGTIVAASTTTVSPPTNGSLVNIGNGSFQYTPAPNFFGIDAFSYRVQDNQGAFSNTATVTVTVNSVNDAPTAQNDDATTSQGSLITVNVLVNNGHGFDADLDGSVVAATVMAQSSPANGTLFNNGDGTFDYTPNPSFLGVDSFTYSLQDDGGAFSNTATVTITVSNTNNPPVALDDTFATPLNTAIVLDVLADNGSGADYDADGVLVPATTSPLSSPAHGQLINNGDGSFLFTPDNGYAGVDSFTYAVTDSDGATSNTATVTITIGDPTSLALYFALDDAHTFGNGLTVEEEDLVTYDGIDFSLLFDGSDVGLANEKLASVSVISPTEILMSFSSEATVPGIANPVQPTDVVKFNAMQLGPTTAGTFELYFRGANVGFDVSGEAIDGLKLLDDGRLVISTLSSFSVPGASGKDEDLLAFTPTALGAATAGTWEMYFDGGDVGWSGHDVDAVAVDNAGKIYLSGKADLTLPIGLVTDNDVAVFVPTSLGLTTNGSYESALFFDGGNFGLDTLNLKAIDITGAGPEALRASSVGTSAPATSGQPLTQDDVEKVLPYALATWQAAGFDVAPVAAVSIYVDQLPGAQLGQAFGQAITLDRDAAGGVWHIDPTSAAIKTGHYDLLSVLTHELGHVLGFAHADGEAVMSARLAAATRLQPEASGQYRESEAAFLTHAELDNFWSQTNDSFRRKPHRFDGKTIDLDTDRKSRRMLDPISVDKFLALRRNWVIKDDDQTLQEDGDSPLDAAIELLLDDCLNVG